MKNIRLALCCWKSICCNLMSTIGIWLSSQNPCHIHWSCMNKKYFYCNVQHLWVNDIFHKIIRKINDSPKFIKTTWVTLVHKGKREDTVASSWTEVHYSIAWVCWCIGLFCYGSHPCLSVTAKRVWKLCIETVWLLHSQSRILTKENVKQ